MSYNGINRRVGKIDKMIRMPLSTVVMYILLVAVLAFWLFIGIILAYPFEVMRVDDIKTDKLVAKAGDKISFQLFGEKFSDIPSKVTVELVNGEAISIMSYQSSYPKTTEFKPRSFIIPYSVSAGEYKVRWTADYELFGIRNIRVVALSQCVKISEWKRSKYK